MHKKKSIISGLALASLAFTAHTHAQFSPIPLAPTSYNYDVVVEKEGPHPFVPATTASMDGGTNNTGATWYELGYNVNAPETGIPAPGTVFTALDLPDHSFSTAPSYTAPNAILLNSAVTNGTFNVTTPAAYSSLSFLAGSGNGAITVGYTLRFTDGSTETGTFESPDWFNATPIAYVANGRVDAQSGGFSAVNENNPRLYAIDVAVANSSKQLASVDFTWNAGTGRAAVMGVSGSTGAEFTPIAVTGYAFDMVVEATASVAEPLNVTTATVDAGQLNTGFTIYERGYNANAPLTGLPAPNTTLTNVSAPDHVYRLAPSYVNANNAILIDGSDTISILGFTTPANYSALSFLAHSGGGTVTVDFTIEHTDSTVQTGQFVIPDWFNVTPYAYNLSGRVSADNGGYSAVGTENPRLYSIDVAVTQTAKPINSVTLNYSTGNGHGVILAVSGTAGAVRPLFDVQPVSVNTAAGTATELTAAVSGTAPFTYQWQRNENGAFVSVANTASTTGATTATLSFAAPTLADAGVYHLLASNVAGVSTSSVVNVNIVSDKLDVTAPGDTITSFSGTSPAGEPVENSIDDTTSKYLNFGTDGNTAAPFVGPVGLVVTPSQGPTVLTGLRIYTANDAVDRDPIDYILEGSVDAGVSFSAIASGSLALPSARNAAALPLDPLTMPNQEVSFANDIAYTTYRVTFTNVKNNGAANSMQIGEIELLGGPGVLRTRANIARNADGTITISWSGSGSLQSTPTLTNPQWQPVTGTSPLTLPTTDRMRFFRVVE